MAPGRKVRRRAAAPDLEDSGLRVAALAALDAETKAVSTHFSDDSRLRTMEAWLLKWGLSMFPPTIASFKAVAATLKAGDIKALRFISKFIGQKQNEEDTAPPSCRCARSRTASAPALVAWVPLRDRGHYLWSCWANFLQGVTLGVWMGHSTPERQW